MTANVLASAASTAAWSHWTALGVNGVTPPPDTAVDLEALIALTAVIADVDPRLRDEAVDWCVQFGGRFVATGRLRTLASRLDAEGQRRAQTLIATVSSLGPSGWKASEPPLRMTPSGKSRLPSLDSAALALLRLRCVFGVTARAEVLLSMLTQPDVPVVASELTELGYGKSAIASTLDDLHLAGLLQRRTLGNAHAYQLRRSDEMRELLGPVPPRQRRWHLRFPLLAAAVQLEASVAKKSGLVQGIEARKFLGAHLRDLARIDLEPPTVDDPKAYWATVQTWLAMALAS